MRMTKTIKRVLLSVCSAVFGLMMGVLVFLGAPVNVKADVTTTTVMYCDGASIRLAEDGKNGIRFHVRVTSNEEGTVKLGDNTYSEDEFKALETGILVIPTDKLSSSEELTIAGAKTAYASGAKAANVTGDQCVWNLKSDDKGNYFYEATAYVYNIPETSYERTFTFRGYYSLDGENYVYTKNENNVRSVAHVAWKAKADNYDGEFVAQLNSFLADVELENKFTQNFVYRVGNQNAVKLSSLFAIPEYITSEALSIEAESVYGNASLIPNLENGTLQFSGTGVSAITLTDTVTLKSVELNLEVVDAVNVTTYGEIKRQQNSVLLNDVKMGNTALWFDDATLYGNGFTFDATDALYTGVDYDYNSYVIALVNSTLDNVNIIGKVYPELGGTKTDNYNRALVLSSGNCRIVNSYLSNCASPIRNGGELEVVNTTLKGGVFANLDFRAGHIILDNVTTINQASSNDKTADGKTIVGLGISTYNEGGNAGMSITIRNALTQYNYISKNDKDTLNSYAQTISDTMFGSDFAKYQYTDASGVVWVNAGILSMNEYFQASGIIDERSDKQNYTGTAKTIAVALTKQNCYVYTFKPTSVLKAPAYVTAGQGVIAPNYSFDYTTKNYIAKVDGSNDYCYEADGVVYISMDEGETFNWDTSILSVEKNGQQLAYTVAMNGTDYTGKAISFKTSGDYEVVYTYTDGYNYNADGTYEVTYQKVVKINVITVKPNAKNAQFSFGAGGTAYTSKTVMVGDKTYVMPNVSATVSGKIGSKTIDGVTVYYPITEMYTSDGKTAHTGKWYACFPIFKDALQIIDYADKGTGAAVTYNQTTVTAVSQIPSTLKATNPTSAFLYSMNATNYPPPTDPTAVSGAVCYTCNRNGLTASNTRKEENTVAEYTYTDNAGVVYYYYIGYHCAEQTKGSSCLVEGTMITMADGSQKAVENIVAGDKVMVFNHETGKYEVSAVWFNDHANEAATLRNVINLEFSNGSSARIAYEHAYFDLDLMQYVFINEDNMHEFVGHRFVATSYNGMEMVQSETVLVKAYVTEEVVKVYGPITEYHFNLVSDDMLSMPSFNFDANGMVNIFEYDENLRYNEEKMQADINTYGVFTYEEFSEYMSYEDYCKAPIQYFKVAIGKGNLTWEQVELTLQYLAENEF